MTPELHGKLTKTVSFAIGLCGSVKPEKQAEAAIEAILIDYEILAKGRYDMR